MCSGSASAGQFELTPRNNPGSVRQFNYVIAALVWEATCMYRLGGLTGILFGITASMLSSQFRKMGR